LNQNNIAIKNRLEQDSNLRPLTESSASFPLHPKETCKEGAVAGCGGVLRGSDGEWLGGFARSLGLCSAHVAELWGVLEGLRYARSLDFRRVELHVDSVAVVKILNSGGYGTSDGRSLVMKIRRMLDMDWEVVVNHIYREAN